MVVTVGRHEDRAAAPMRPARCRASHVPLPHFILERTASTCCACGHIGDFLIQAGLAADMPVCRPRIGALEAVRRFAYTILVRRHHWVTFSSRTSVNNPAPRINAIPTAIGQSR